MNGAARHDDGAFFPSFSFKMRPPTLLIYITLNASTGILSVKPAYKQLKNGL